MTTKPVAIVLDGRLGRIEGTLEATDARGLSGKLSLSLRRQLPTGDVAAVPFRLMVFRTVTPDNDGHFRFVDLPPGTYEIDPASGEGALVSTDPVAQDRGRPERGGQGRGPARAADRDHRAGRRCPDRPGDRGGRGPLGHDHPAECRSSYVGQAQTDADGRYTIGGKPGKMPVEPRLGAEGLHRAPGLAAPHPGRPGRPRPGPT